MEDLPSCRLDMEKAQFRLLEMGRAGQLHFGQHLTDTIDSLMRIRTLPNGRIYLPSIDESARVSANTIGHMMLRANNLADF